MKKDWIVNLLIILLLAGLAFLLYRVAGGDLTAWLDALKTGKFADNFFGGIVNGMRSVSDGIGNAFGQLKP